MDLSETYIIDLVKINPDLNDFAKIDELDYLEKKVINTFSPEYNKKESEVARKYMKLLKNKKHLTTSEELLKIDLQRLFKQVDFPDIYFPITPLNNYFIERISYRIKHSRP